METLVVNQHKNHHHHQYYGSYKGYNPVRCSYSPPSSPFRGINCRTFQSGAGILPTPVTHKTSTFTSEKTPSPAIKIHGVTRSSPIAINIPAKAIAFDEEGIFSENLSFSERWAGPAYSNSPPPSSLPIPKFSMRPKRTVSLELEPVSDLGIELERPIAKSAPASPTRERGPSTRELFLSADSATKTLRRILNLDVGDEGF